MVLDTIDVAALREWLTDQDYLPNDINDVVLQKFLHSSYGNLDQSKKYIENFCTSRSNLPEIFLNRNPLSEDIQKVFTYSFMYFYMAGENEIIFYHLDDPDLKKYNFYAITKVTQMVFDYWIQESSNFPNGHFFLWDAKNFPFKVITKINIGVFRRFVRYVMDSVPLRVKQAHIFNCPSHINRFYALFKSLLPQHIKESMFFHSNIESLQMAIGKEYLPMEYGGDLPSFKEMHMHTVKQIEAHSDFFLDEHKWKTNLSKVPKNKMATSKSPFKTLTID